MSKDKMTKGKKALIVAFGAGALLLGAVATFSITNKVAPVSSGLYGALNESDGTTLGGYDAVSYFDGSPEQGKAEHSLVWKGASWRFSSAENLKTFEANPDAYAPQFGGFCAFAVSKGFTAKSNPTVFHIHNDQLFVFDSTDVKQAWLQSLNPDVLSESEKRWASR